MLIISESWRKENSDQKGRGRRPPVPFIRNNHPVVFSDILWLARWFDSAFIAWSAA